MASERAMKKAAEILDNFDLVQAVGDDRGRGPAEVLADELDDFVRPGIRAGEVPTNRTDLVLTWTREELRRNGRYYADWAQRYLDRDDDNKMSEELCTLLCALRDVADVVSRIGDD